MIERNDSLNDLLKEQESQLAAIHQEQTKAGSQELDIDAIRKELYATLSFEGEIDSALVATILDKIVVKKESTKKEIHLDIYLKLGQKYEAVYSPQKISASLTPTKNTTPKPPTRRILFPSARLGLLRASKALTPARGRGWRPTPQDAWKMKF